MWLSVHGLHGTEENTGEDGRADNLIDHSLRGDSRCRRRSFRHDGTVEETIPVVAERSVNAHAERAHLRGATHVPWLAFREIRGLCHNIAQSKTRQRLVTRAVGISNEICQ